MKRILLLAALVCSTIMASATDYYKITEFPIDGADIRDTFLIAVEYANNTYIWDGQNHSGKNYVCLEHYSNTTISGNYKENEVAIMHNSYHAYWKLFSLLSRGDGAREDKGGYYVAGVGGTNGITFNDGQRNAEIELQSDGIHIATKSGVGVFRFNITPNDPHGFKFYEHDINMLHPALYVKGNIARYKPITSGTTTAIDNQPVSREITTDPVTDNPSPVTTKLLRSGHLYIEKDGQLYNTQGVRVK